MAPGVPLTGTQGNLDVFYSIPAERRARSGYLLDPRGFDMTALDVVAQTELGTGGLREWMLDNLVPLLLLAVAVLLIWLGGGKGDNAGVMRRVGGVIIALGVIGLAVSGAGVDLGTWIAGLFSG